MMGSLRDGSTNKWKITDTQNANQYLLKGHWKEEQALPLDTQEQALDLSMNIKLLAFNVLISRHISQANPQKVA